MSRHEDHLTHGVTLRQSASLCAGNFLECEPTRAVRALQILEAWWGSGAISGYRWRDKSSALTVNWQSRSAGDELQKPQPVLCRVLSDNLCSEE